ncbi:Extracellular matrix protein fras1 [Rhodotorula kratochvilovae]
MRLVALVALVATAAPFAFAAPTVAACPGTRQYRDAATGLCKQCPLTMTSCSSATVAITCNRGRYLTADKQCVLATACPTNTFADATTQSCKKCYQVNAATCKDASATGSTSCLSGSCLQDNKCVYTNRMQVGFFCSSTGVMTSCGDGVTKCDSTGAATSCKTGYTRTTAGACVKCATDQTFDAASQTCKSTAASCAALGDHFFNTVTNFCEPICQRGRLNQQWGYYIEAEYYDCANADQIWDATAAVCKLTCGDAQYTTDTEGMVTLTKAATYANTAAQSCSACTDKLSARTCDSTGRSSSCLPGYKLVDGSCNHCEAVGRVFQPSTGECKEVTCPTATFTTGEDGNAYNVKAAQRLDASTGSCVACNDAYARNCDSTGKAVACLPPYNLGADGTCIKCSSADQTVFDTVTRTCKLSCRGYAIYGYDGGSTSVGTVFERANRLDETTGTCVDCDDPNAQMCDATGYTSNCVTGYVLFSGQCYRCPRSTGTFNTETVFCEPRCDSGSVNQWGNYIRAQYYDYTTQSCQTCQHTGAGDCDSKGNALNCIDGYQFSGGECIR